MVSRKEFAIIGCTIAGAMIALVAVGWFLLDLSRSDRLWETSDPNEFADALLDTPAAVPTGRIDGSRYLLRYKLKPWSATPASAVTASNRNAAKIVPLVFERLFARVDEVQIEEIGEFTDSRGNKRESVAITMTFTRATSSRIPWDSIQSTEVPKLADSYWQHPSFD
jgi:hypothetical protein